jgi:xanthine/CO dehydrogenase XdhC/CoxF family maturation factor
MEGLQIYRKHYSDDFKGVRMCLGELTVSLSAIGDRDRLESIWRESLRIRQQQFGDEHSTVEKALRQLPSDPRADGQK